MSTETTRSFPLTHPDGARRFAIAPGSELPIATWLAVAALLAGEVLWISLRFDARQIGSADSASWYALPLAWASTIFRGLVVALAVTLVIGGKRLVGDLADWSRSAADRGASPGFLAGNLASFAIFFGLSTVVLDGGLHGRHYQGIWALGWLLAGLSTTFLALAAAIPPGSWWRLIRGQLGPIAAGLAAAALATLVSEGSASLWAPLAGATFRVVALILGLFEPIVISRPAEMIVGTPRFEGNIAPVCSGFEGIGMTLALLAGYLWYDRDGLRFPRALLLLPLGVALIWICNCLRISALILIGSWGYPAIALGGFHSQAGWLAFNAVGLGTIALARLPGFRRARDASADSPPVEVAGRNPVVPYVLPLMSLVATMMIVTALSPTGGFDRGYPVRVVVALAVFWSLRRRYVDSLWSWSWTGPAIGLLVFVVWMALEPIQSVSSGATSNPMTQPPAWAAIWLIFRVVGSVVTVPMAEELAFRGFLLRRLISADFEGVPAGRFTWVSFLGSSLLFGAMHGRWVAGTLAGAAYALAVYRRGRLSDAVVAHATTNALIAAYVVSTGDWSLWS